MAKGLGSGLGALFGDETMEQDGSLKRVPVTKLEPRPDQPRSRFDPEKLEELAQSIRDHGVLQPITVRDMGFGRYEIVAGERRWRAARMAGLAEVPVNIVDVSDREAAEIALIENLQREDLNPLEEARGYETLMDRHGLTQEQVAERVGKSRPAVANALRLLRLPPRAVALTEAGRLTVSQAKALLEVDDADFQDELAVKAAEQDLSVREIAAAVKKVKSEREKRPRPKRNYRLGPDGIDYAAELERELSGVLGRKVTIQPGRESGKLTLDYYSDKDLTALVKALKTIKMEWEQS